MELMTDIVHSLLKLGFLSAPEILQMRIDHDAAADLLLPYSTDVTSDRFHDNDKFSSLTILV